MSISSAKCTFIVITESVIEMWEQNLRLVCFSLRSAGTHKGNSAKLFFVKKFLSRILQDLSSRKVHVIFQNKSTLILKPGEH